MVHRLEARVRKIETALQGAGQMRIISGHSDDEYKRTIRRMIDDGRASEGDFFVCIRLFSEPGEVAA